MSLVEDIPAPHTIAQREAILRPLLRTYGAHPEFFAALRRGMRCAEGPDTLLHLWGHPMNQESEVFVHATYPRQVDAVHAVTALVDAQFPPDKVGALMCHPEGVQELKITHSTDVGPGTVIGLGVGAVAGAIATASGLMVAGPAFFGLDGVLLGSAIGMLIGTLARFGFWKDEIKFPAGAFAQGAGSVLIGISTAESRVEAARCALLHAGAHEVHVSLRQSQPDLA